MSEGRLFDLEAARMARAEAKGDPPVVTFAGETFTFPVELPMRYVWTLAEDGDDQEALKSLFNGQWNRFVEVVDPSREDILALIAEIPKLYGLQQGESSASAGSSKAASSHSRPTSPATTAPTSAKRATARRRSG